MRFTVRSRFEPSTSLAKRLKRSAVLAALLVSAVGCASRPGLWSSGRWVDLTHSFSAATVYWPTATPFRLEPVFVGTTKKGFHYEAYQFRAAEHGGTHLDAPNHFSANGLAVDRIPLDRLIGPAVVIDVSSKAAENPDYRVSLDDLAVWEEGHGPIPEQAIVLLRTGYDRFWPDPVKYLGTAERGEAAVAKLHFPGLDPEAARWLAQQRRIKAVGLDTASIDYGQSSHFETHRILSQKRIPIFENVARLGELPATGAVVVALPMKIEGGSGAPLRIIAWAPEKNR
ncbi:cyclase family protein [Methylocaldum sp.]|uniref:cyclase family protein n=1 Tax=Methylocaldum sp. TaxID=1969727 RepID=UPI002D759B39|nr:cyclase family protein [Methylocaldum sp.]HYE35433.1 cyclase family protein [Methylocaldum sp.]